MNFNKTTKYALQIFSLIALDEHKLYTAIELSEQLQIPYRYLRKLMQEFQKNGLLKSVQGKEGGYLLTKSLTDISLYEIVMLTDANQIDTHCFFGFKDCALVDKCSMHNKWGELRDVWLQTMKGTTLEDIKNNNINSNFLINNLI